MQVALNFASPTEASDGFGWGFVGDQVGENVCKVLETVWHLLVESEVLIVSAVGTACAHDGEVGKFGCDVFDQFLAEGMWDRDVGGLSVKGSDWGWEEGLQALWDVVAGGKTEGFGDSRHSTAGGTVVDVVFDDTYIFGEKGILGL